MQSYSSPTFQFLFLRNKARSSDSKHPVQLIPPFSKRGAFRSGAGEPTFLITARAQNPEGVSFIHRVKKDGTKNAYEFTELTFGFADAARFCKSRNGRSLIKLESLNNLTGETRCRFDDVRAISAASKSSLKKK